MRISKKSAVFAAEDDMNFDSLDEDLDENDGEFESDSDQELDDYVEDDIEEIDEDDVDIDTDNNIANHYIAECDACHGVFISAMIESDQQVDHISGICPLCNKDSDQYLKWIIRDVDDVK